MKNQNYNFINRLIDIFLSIIGIVIFSIPFIFIIILVKIQLGTPIFFTQIRAGKAGKPFKLIKMRTMTNERGSNGELLPDDIRLTKFGRALRSTSLDELPELWNILKGEMSIVGPRPLHMSYLHLYSKEEARRHDVKPGLTGWAQINGRNSISWDEKFKLDIWYIDNKSILLDFKIIILTLFAIFNRKNINDVNNETMKPFRGNKINKNNLDYE